MRAPSSAEGHRGRLLPRRLAGSEQVRHVDQPGLCRGWSRAYGNGNSVLGNQGYGANYYESRATTDLSQIQVGMLLSAQYGRIPKRATPTATSPSISETAWSWTVSTPASAPRPSPNGWRITAVAGSSAATRGIGAETYRKGYGDMGNLKAFIEEHRKGTAIASSSCCSSSPAPP